MNAKKSKDGDLTTKIVSGVATLAAGFAARKAIEFGWKKVIGKEPPTEPESPEVALGEAIGWAIVMGVGMEITKLLTNRTVAKRLHKKATEVAEVTE